MGKSASFKCVCCDANQSCPIGPYDLPATNHLEGRPESWSYSLVECRSCGHVAAHPLPDRKELNQHYESSDFWEGHGLEHASAATEWRAQLIGNSSLWERYRRAATQFELIRSTVSLKPDTRIIDLGSGYAPFLYHCRCGGHRNLYALEPSADICGYLESQGIKTYNCLLEDFVERDDLPKFETVVISHTAEHLSDPRGVIASLKRHLSPTSVLYIDVPFQDHLRPHHQGLHLQFFNENSIARLVSECGFRTIEVEADRHNLLERTVLAFLYAIYGRMYRKRRGGIAPSDHIELLHRFVWRPLRRLFRLRINIFISSADLRILASPDTE